jgi:hypothetical protein
VVVLLIAYWFGVLVVARVLVQVCAGCEDGTGTPEALAVVQTLFTEAKAIVASRLAKQTGAAIVGNIGGISSDGGGSGGDGKNPNGIVTGVKAALLAEISLGRDTLRKVPAEELQLKADVMLTPRDVLNAAIKEGPTLRVASARLLEARDPDRHYITLVNSLAGVGHMLCVHRFLLEI